MPITFKKRLLNSNDNIIPVKLAAVVEAGRKGIWEATNRHGDFPKLYYVTLEGSKRSHHVLRIELVKGCNEELKSVILEDARIIYNVDVVPVFDHSFILEFLPN